MPPTSLSKKINADNAPPIIEVDPALQRDVHFVLKLTALLKKPPPPPPPPVEEPKEENASPPMTPLSPEPPADPKKKGKGAAAKKESPPKKANAKGAKAQEVAVEPEVPAPPPPPPDPYSLLLMLRYTLFTDQDILLPPTASTDVEVDGEPRKQFVCESHARILVKEDVIRNMAANRGCINLGLDLMATGLSNSGPPATGDAKNKKNIKKDAKDDAGPGGPYKSYSLPLNAAGLLVGDTNASMTWPSKLVLLPPDIQEMFDSVSASIQALNIPPPPEPTEPVPLTPKGAKGAPPKGKGPKIEAPPEDLSQMSGDPISILPPDVAAQLNPIILQVSKARSMPDLPATRNHLDKKCYPPRLRLAWPEGGQLRDQPCLSLPWEPHSLEPGLNVRTLLCGSAEVMLGGDFADLTALLDSAAEKPLVVEVHDRDAVPEPPEFPLPSTESEVEGEKPDDSYVCGIARVSLLALARGATYAKFTVPIMPHTTVRGAASLDWSTRPGNYGQAASVLKGIMRCAVPLSATVVPTINERPFTRAIFVMDYQDSELFHLLEDTVRKQNALALKLAQPRTVDEEAKIPEHLRVMDDAMSVFGRARTEYGSDAESIDVGAALASRAATAATVAPPHVADVINNNNSPPDSREFLPPIPHAELRFSVGTEGPPDSSEGPGTAGDYSPRKALRFNAAKGGGGHNSDSDSESEVPPTAIELALERLLADIDEIDLDMRLLQTLSTTKLGSEADTDPDLDILTGFHLVDGKERMIVLEGLASGAMSIVKGIADMALEDNRPQENWRSRTVVINPLIRHTSRLYTSLGVDLWIIKLRSPLSKIVSEASSYATGKVRVDCIAGVRKLMALHSITWARQAHDLGIWPTPHMVSLVDKKFGGELTRSDVLGIEADEYDSEEEDGGPVGLGAISDGTSSCDARSLRSSKSGRSKKSAMTMRSKRSARTRKSAASKKGAIAAPRKRLHPLLRPPVDMDNMVYLDMRRAAAAQRATKDIIAANISSLSNVYSTRGASVRNLWETWNPRLRRAEGEEAGQGDGGYSDGEDGKPPFRWPASRTPADFMAHPKKPNKVRIEELSEPWVECELFKPVDMRLGPPPGVTNFKTAIAVDHQLFTKDPEYWKTVHLGGEGAEAEAEAVQKAEMAVWKKKLVGPPVMKTLVPLHTKPSQTDRLKHILLDPPVKKGFKIAHVPPEPISMQLQEPWLEPMLFSSTQPKSRKDNFSGRKDFKTTLPKEKSALSKPGFDQSWYGSLHDNLA